MADTPNAREEKDQEILKDKGLRTLFQCMCIGLAVIVLVSFFAARGQTFSGYCRQLGLSLLIALAAMVAGGFLGFLFGIPRSLQKADANQHRTFSSNTNLEEVSDWLTKIIVGISLVQLPVIIKRFNSWSRLLAQAFEQDLGAPNALPYVYGLQVFYSICGFFIVYLWSRLYLMKQLDVLERSFDQRIVAVVDAKVEAGVGGVESRVDEKLELRTLINQKDEFNKLVTMMTNLENREEFKPVIQAAQPGPFAYIEDCQKGRWGGQPVKQGYELNAAFKNKEAAHDIYYVTLRVTGAPAQPLTGDVYFFLHDSYFPDCIVKVKAVDNLASLEIASREAFTVGAYCVDQQIKLELDLNLYAGTPEGYKYREKLVTIDEVTTELNRKTDALNPR
jgi:hypothetical protein